MSLGGGTRLADLPGESLAGASGACRLPACSSVPRGAATAAAAPAAADVATLSVWSSDRTENLLWERLATPFC